MAGKHYWRNWTTNIRLEQLPQSSSSTTASPRLKFVTMNNLSDNWRRFQFWARFPQRCNKWSHVEPATNADIFPKILGKHRADWHESACGIHCRLSDLTNICGPKWLASKTVILHWVCMCKGGDTKSWAEVLCWKKSRHFWRCRWRVLTWAWKKKEVPKSFLTQTGCWYKMDQNIPHPTKVIHLPQKMRGTDVNKHMKALLT